ncbi:MAG: hypothetical protein K8S97_04050, partial [Anaerolineae bacterium]|nr:hypothetical protein [Anaerolineae bacterium]
MAKLIILFKQNVTSPKFEMDFTRALALLKKMPGVRRIVQSNVIGGPGGKTPYRQILELSFDDFAALDAALVSQQGVVAGKTLMAITDGEVELLFAEDKGTPIVMSLEPKHLQAYLEEHKINAEIIFPDAPTPTVAKAAEALDVSEEQIVKTMVFMVNDRPFVVYANGTRRVDARKLAERLSVSRKRVKPANANQVLNLTGYEVGAVPPVGFREHIPAFMDPAVREHEIIYAGGGAKNAMLKLTSTELLRVTHAEVAPMVQENAPDVSGAPETPDAPTDANDTNAEA